MESRREELSRLSIEEVRKLAADRGLRTSGLKSRIIDDIIKHDNKIPVPKGRKSEMITETKRDLDTKNKTNLSPERSSIYNIPLDVKKQSALGLNYPDILNLCKTDKQLSSICSDPNFWKNKLSRDYSEVNISRLKGPQFRAKYEQLYVKKISNEIRNVNLEFEKELEKVKNRYKMKLDNLEANRLVLINNFKNLIAEDYDRKYIAIKVTEQQLRDIYNEIVRLFNTDTLNISILKAELIEDGIDVLDIDLNPGNLIGLVTDNSNKPEILIYIYRYRNPNQPEYVYDNFSYSVETHGPLKQYPYKLAESMKKDNYTVADIPEVYKLPFSTKGFRVTGPWPIEK